MRIQGLGSNEILLVDRHKMDPWTFDEGWRPKSDKSRLNLRATILEGKSIGSNQKKKQKRRVHDLKNQDAS